MKLFIKLTPNSKHSSITKTDKNKFSIKVTEPAKEGKANKALIDLLADHLNIAKSRMSIKSGSKSKNKIIEIV